MTRVAPLRPGHAALARALSRYADAAPPSITEVRSAVTAFAAELAPGPSAPSSAERLVAALKQCVQQHAPRRLDAGERAALTDLLVRWASETRR